MAKLVSIMGVLAACSAVAFVTVAHATNDRVVNGADQSVVSERHAAIEEFSAQSRRVYRAPRRVRIYGAQLSPNAVRVCNAYYVPEYRPSGTVIVPRMNCYWRG